SRLTSALYEKKIKGKWWKSELVRHLFRDVLGVTVITSIFIACVAYLIGWVRGFPFHWVLLTQTVAFALFTGLLLFGVLFCLSMFGSQYVFKKGHDPDNYLIPLASAIGDLGSMALLAAALAWVF
ncbi:MAG: magnesium transporter, partial [Nanoarchaeota archaeon]